MCELFAMTSAEVAIVSYELQSFAAEGGERHRNRDGWGIMFAEERDAHVFREAAPASNSELARMVFEREIACRHLIAHVRRASKGQPLLANTHPFTRTRKGRAHHFAHNGTLHGIEQLAESKPLLSERVGDTDSELAFLLLLSRLDALDEMAGDEEEFATFARFAAEMQELGSSNFLFFDGRSLFVHADRRAFETPDGLTEPREPGLVMRHFGDCEPGQDYNLCGPRMSDVSPRTLVFASVPLDDTEWQPLARGTSLHLRNGVEIARQVA
ncbi:class II glutamine amidotransferase [Altererythrobacter indicus]|uniref:Class II glutamine amidotransferase n=1 Tax=Altericroceibacterium indicum TaxID=374177 RepID=A0A845AC22_9SPHN|nr:class II glutamine amidotransferase [Altericroceibacterium indicum]MXP26096.1 class II glutamine amidotransferase [Altericroceibacterium indicum]